MADYPSLLADTERGEAEPVGLAKISAEFSAGAGPVMAGACARADVNGGQPARQDGALVTPDDVWPVIFPVVATAAAGTSDVTDWGPPTGYAWRITEVPIVLGTGTSLVQVFLESALTGKGPVFQTSGSGLWEPSRLFLQYGERLVITTTGGGATLAPRGERIRLSFLPTYMA